MKRRPAPQVYAASSGRRGKRSPLRLPVTLRATTLPSTFVDFDGPRYPQRRVASMIETNKLERRLTKVWSMRGVEWPEDD